MEAGRRALEGAERRGLDEADAARLLSLVPKRSRRREIWVGLFVLAGVISALTALFVLTDAATFRGRYIVTTHVDDAGGIRRGDPVQMRGVNIGRVQKFIIGPDGVDVRLELEGEYRVPKDSRVVLRSNGLLGGLVADVIPGNSPERLEGGAVLPGRKEGGLFDQVGTLGARADGVLGQLDALLSDATVEALGEGATELRGLLAELRGLAEAERRELVALTESLARSARGLERVTTAEELDRIVARIDSLTIRAEATTSNLSRASASLEVILARLERGEGTLGRLSTDESLYRNLNAVAESLHRLLEDLQANPRRYINLEIF
jgi:phospholipid/cholesterol/gamma-HCH transport system substrate-binding protein